MGMGDGRNTRAEAARGKKQPSPPDMGKKGKITLSLKKTETVAVIEVSDNGIGLPAGFELSTVDSMGLSLVNSLVEQIEGDFNIESKNGTRCILEINIENEGSK